MVGCAAPASGKSAWNWPPFAKKKEDEGPKLPTPADRIKAIRELAKQAPSMSEQQQLADSEKLAKLSNDEQDAAIRLAMIVALGSFRTSVASSTLYAAIKDPDRDVRVAACRAWSIRADADAGKVLGEVLTSDNDRDVRLAALRGLGNVHDPAAVVFVGPTLEDPDPAVQHRAVVSLQSMTGKHFGNDVNAWARVRARHVTSAARTVARHSFARKILLTLIKTELPSSQENRRSVRRRGPATGPCLNSAIFSGCAG